MKTDNYRYQLKGSLNVTTKRLDFLSQEVLLPHMISNSMKLEYDSPATNKHSILSIIMDQYRLKRASKFDKDDPNTFLYFRLPVKSKVDKNSDLVESLPSESLSSNESCEE